MSEPLEHAEKKEANMAIEKTTGAFPNKLKNNLFFIVLISNCGSGKEEQRPFNSPK